MKYFSVNNKLNFDKKKLSITYDDVKLYCLFLKIILSYTLFQEDYIRGKIIIYFLIILLIVVLYTNL